MKQSRINNRAFLTIFLLIGLPAASRFLNAQEGEFARETEVVESVNVGGDLEKTNTGIIKVYTVNHHGKLINKGIVETVTVNNSAILTNEKTIDTATVNNEATLINHGIVNSVTVNSAGRLINEGEIRFVTMVNPQASIENRGHLGTLVHVNHDNTFVGIWRSLGQNMYCGLRINPDVTVWELVVGKYRIPVKYKSTMF